MARELGGARDDQAMGELRRDYNENTIREIANFHAQLARECQKIRERVARINESMAAIEFNKDRYIRLEVDDAIDSEIRSFRQELKSCTEGSFTGSREDQYTEQKFLQVKRIIDRFRGREGFADLDRRWTEKVTDVRNWFTFAASERWKEDDSEHEHYADSGGKSGGQKEKLAYTVLAASLAYQFGLEFGDTRSRESSNGCSGSLDPVSMCVRLHFRVSTLSSSNGIDKYSRSGLTTYCLPKRSTSATAAVANSSAATAFAFALNWFAFGCLTRLFAKRRATAT